MEERRREQSGAHRGIGQKRILPALTQSSHPPLPALCPTPPHLHPIVAPGSARLVSRLTRTHFSEGRARAPYRAACVPESNPSLTKLRPRPCSYSQWTAEIRFPIRQTPNYWTQGGGYPTSHGGLIDSDPVRQHEWNQYDPALGDAGPGRPRYWCLRAFSSCRVPQAALNSS